MHELGIAQSILEAADREATRHPGARPARIGLRIGPLAGVDRSSLTFCFEALTTSHPIELTIEPGIADELDLCFIDLEEETNPNAH